MHAVAYLCFRDNMIPYSGEIKAEDMQRLSSSDRLIRTETSTLIGLMLKREIDYTLPTPQDLQRYRENTEALLEELHHTMSDAFWGQLDPTKVADKDFNPFTSGAALREPIFYGGESAYSFQYRDFSLAKYGRDDPWLIANRGFSIQEARDVVHAISRILDEKAVATLQSMRSVTPDAWTFLPANTFTADEVANRAFIERETVGQVLAAFSVSPDAHNEHFEALHDFNIANAYPLIRTPDASSIRSKACTRSRRGTHWKAESWPSAASRSWGGT